MSKTIEAWFGKFGWKRNPFSLNLVVDALAGHRDEMAHILEKLEALSGDLLIIGGIGTGKTILLQWLEKNLKNKFKAIYVNRPPEIPQELIDRLASSLSSQAADIRHYTLFDLQNLCRNYGKSILLLLDEAHEFTEEFEHFLQTLSDLPNVYIVMAGLPQAREKLKKELPALFDRVVDSVLLGSLTLEETEEMILKRIGYGGGQGLGPFTPAAIEKIYDLSYGVPRGILKICDWVVSRAASADKTLLTAEDVTAYSEGIEIAKLREG